MSTYAAILVLLEPLLFNCYTLLLLVFMSQDESVLKGKLFADVEEVKQKNGRSTKRHQNRQVQKLS